MGETVEETLTEIAQTRAKLEADIDVLFARLPDRDVLAKRAKTLGAAAAGTAVVVTVAGLQLAKRSELKARRTEARINAEELARAFSPHPVEVDDDGGSALPLLAALVAIIGAVVAFLQRRE